MLLAKIVENNNRRSEIRKNTTYTNTNRAKRTRRNKQGIDPFREDRSVIVMIVAS